MQSTATRNRLPRAERRLGIVIIALLGLLALGAIVTVERTDVTHAPAAIVNPMPRTLPDPSVVRPASYEQMRFFEINMLPGDDAPLVAPFDDRLKERY
jgi:hypothetical protein